MMLDFLTCPKCGSPVGMQLEDGGYDTERDRLRMHCTKCNAAILVKPLDHPDRKATARWRQRLQRWGIMP